MPNSPSDQEPSIEEILASIRQIISDDDGEGGVAAEPVIEAVEPPSPTPQPAPTPVKPPAAKAPPAPAPPPLDDDILELTQRIDEPEPAPRFQPEPEPAFEPEPDVPETAFAPPPPMPKPRADKPAASKPTAAIGDSILTSGAASAALQGFSRLAGTVPIERAPASGGEGVTLEDIVRDMLRPMLRDWLDHNLPPMIEKLVAKELEKLARQAQD